MKRYSKQNDTALKGLELLLLLTQDEQKFSEAINCYSQESIAKCINTYNLAGLDVVETDGKYVIKNMPIELDLTKEEIKAFLYLETTAQTLQDDKIKQEYTALFDHLKKYFSPENLKTYNHLKEKSKIEVPNEIQLIEADDEYFHSSKTTVFECYGRLIKNYKLKDFETIIDMKDDKLIVSNSNENRETLIRRLLRYGENCKVLKPESFKTEFAKTIDEMINNLERNEA